LGVVALLGGCGAVAGGLLIGGGVAVGRLSVKTSLTQNALVQGSDGHLGLVVGITAAELHGPRPPLNAALVIDRSGSMSGDKIRYAKTAAKDFIRAMRAGDRIALITYSNDAELVVPSTSLTEESQMQAIEAVDRIVPSGMTYLSGGLLLGRDQVLGHAGEGRVNRIILISDGIANVGITDPNELSRLAEDLRERDISVSAMGVGLDFNEDVMMRIADRGGGNYYYIRDAHRMAQAFQSEFGSLAGTVARKPEIRLYLAPGVRVQSVHGYPFEQRGNEVRVRLSDIPGGARRKVVVSLKAPTQEIGVRPLANVAFEYEPPGGRRESARAQVLAEVTPDLYRATRSVDPYAMKEASRAEAADALHRSMIQYERGDAAGAARELQATQQRIKDRAKRYRFDDDLIQGSLHNAARAVQAAPASPQSAPAVDMRKSIKEKAQEMAR
jgi:Ca-activated chloride channel family protein